jgi:hypothetical protein
MSDYLLPFQPSLAQATNTRLDSACKHIQQCRVSTDDMMRFVREDAEEIQRNKYRYCIHKDELVVGIGRPWCPLFLSLALVFLSTFLLVPTLCVWGSQEHGGRDEAHLQLRVPQGHQQPGRPVRLPGLAQRHQHDPLHESLRQVRPRARQDHSLFPAERPLAGQIPRGGSRPPGCHAHPARGVPGLQGQAQLPRPDGHQQVDAHDDRPLCRRLLQHRGVRASQHGGHHDLRDDRGAPHGHERGL